MITFRIAPVLLALASIAVAATAPPDFVGIKWGASMQAAASAMASRGASADAKSSKPDRPVFSGGTFAGFPVHHWDLDFDNGKFVGGQVVLAETPKAEETFRKLREELNGKYGTAGGAQVGRRRAPHFVFGLGWRDSGVRPPALHAEWEAESGLDRRTVAIHLWVEKKRVHLAYTDRSATPAPTAPTTRKSDL